MKSKAEKRAYWTTYRHRQSKKILAMQRMYRKRYTMSWLSVIPAKTQCQICGKEPIDHHPNSWLRRHPYNEKNKKVWDECKFGMLCLQCNRALPTLNRIEWLEKALAYAKQFVV